MRGVHDLGSLGKLWLLFASGGEGWGAGIGPGAVTHWFPSPWPPMLFPPRLQRLELVKRLGCTDLNSTYSPQKTLSQPTFFSPLVPIVFLCNERVLYLYKCPFLYIRKRLLKKKKKKVITLPAVILRVELLETMTEGFRLAQRPVVVR